MRRRRIDPSDWAWEAAERAFTHFRHPPQVMRSGQSTGPRKMWICDVEGCQLVDFTLDLSPPLCYGGYSNRTK